MYEYYKIQRLQFSGRQMHFIVLFTLFPALTPALIIHENVAFHKANEIALTRSKWLSTFIINLMSHENFLKRVSEDLGKGKITAYSIEKFIIFLLSKVTGE